jgi:hypothetical protein
VSLCERPWYTKRPHVYFCSCCWFLCKNVFLFLYLIGKNSKFLNVYRYYSWLLIIFVSLISWIKKIFFEILGIKLRGLHMLGWHSTTAPPGFLILFVLSLHKNAHYITTAKEVYISKFNKFISQFLFHMMSALPLFCLCQHFITLSIVQVVTTY